MNRAIFAMGLGMAVTGLGAGFNASAHGAQAHVHGSAAMQVVVDGNQMTIELQSPMDSLVGFEHAPRTEKQKQAIKLMQDRFAVPATLFVLAPEAKCSAEPATLTLPFASDDTAGKEKPANEVHSELEATFHFQCEQASKLKTIEVKLFDAFGRLHKIDVQMMTPHGQSAARLTPKQRKLQW